MHNIYGANMKEIFQRSSNSGGESRQSPARSFLKEHKDEVAVAKKVGVAAGAVFLTYATLGRGIYKVAYEKKDSLVAIREVAESIWGFAAGAIGLVGSHPAMALAGYAGWKLWKGANEIRKSGYRPQYQALKAAKLVAKTAAACFVLYHSVLKAADELGNKGAGLGAFANAFNNTMQKVVGPFAGFVFNHPIMTISIIGIWKAGRAVYDHLHLGGKPDRQLAIDASKSLLKGVGIGIAIYEIPARLLDSLINKGKTFGESVYSTLVGAWTDAMKIMAPISSFLVNHPILSMLIAAVSTGAYHGIKLTKKKAGEREAVRVAQEEENRQLVDDYLTNAQQMVDEDSLTDEQYFVYKNTGEVKALAAFMMHQDGYGKEFIASRIRLFPDEKTIVFRENPEPGSP